MKKLLSLCIILLFFSGKLLAQKTITGTVTNENGLPIPDVSVIVKGTTIGTITKSDGTYSLNIPSSAKQLEITSSGFFSQTVDIGPGDTYSVIMAPVLKSLDEVVLTGYSSIKKSKYAGAATKVGKEKVNFVPNASFDQILQGKVPGLLVTVGSGQPGASARVQIRGAVSITGDNSPLYVLDGMPIESGTFQSLNANDFESVEVLRDAIATAQYGNRGSSGVIVVTTKRGRTNKLSVAYSGSGGYTEAGEQKFNMMNSTELLQFQENLGQQVDNGLPGWRYSRKNPANASLPAATLSQYDARLDSLRAINTNWKDVFLRRGTFQSHDLNLSGIAGGNSRYFISGGFYDEDGIGLRSDLKRYTVRANFETRTDKVNFSFNGTGGYAHRNFVESEGGIFLANPFAAGYLGLPYEELYNENGQVVTGPGKTGSNAYDRISTTSLLNDQLKFVASTKLTYNLTKNFYIGGFAGIDYRQTTNESSVYPNTYAANTDVFPTGPPLGDSIGKGSFSKGMNNFMQTVVRGMAGYQKIFADKHDVDIQLISEYTREKVSSFGYIGYGLSPKLLNTPASITPGTVDNALIPNVSGGKSGRSLFGTMLLAQYSFKSKYTFNGSLRRDASSQLPTKNRWTNFYSAGVGWNILMEKFAGNWSIDELKLRASYGTAANADGFPFGNFGYLTTYGNGSYAGNQTIVAANAGNPDLNWEGIATLDIGIDFGFFKNRIEGSVDVYEKKGSDAVVTQKLPAESGFVDQDINAAVVRNRGIELGLDIEVIRGKDIVWSVGGNVAYNKNKVVSLGLVNEFEQGTEIVRVGLPLGSHYSVKWAGVDAATGIPLYYKKDGTITNIYSDNDRVADFGTFDAPWVGGFNTAVIYKGFTLDAVFSFQKGSKRFNNQDFFQLNPAFASQGYNLRREMVTMWQKPGDVTDIQGPLYQRQFISKDIQDASFTRFRTLTLAYNLQRNLIDGLKVFDHVRFYVQGQNLYTWTNWTGFDPEDSNNLASYEYPTPRTLTFGINLTFRQ